MLRNSLRDEIELEESATEHGGGKIELHSVDSKSGEFCGSSFVKWPCKHYVEHLGGVLWTCPGIGETL